MRQTARRVACGHCIGSRLRPLRVRWRHRSECEQAELSRPNVTRVTRVVHRSADGPVPVRLLFDASPAGGCASPLLSYHAEAYGPQCLAASQRIRV